MKHCPLCRAESDDSGELCPRDGSRLVEGPAPPAQEAAWVEVVQPTGETVVAELTGEGVSIGKGPENRVVVTDPAVSRQHAVVRWQQGQWHILDAGSRNGVFVNGQRVGAAGEPIRPGDVVQLGESRLRLVAGSPAGREAAPPAPAGPAGTQVIAGRYELEAELLGDATSTVYRARRRPSGEAVAVRVLRPELFTDPVARERFRRQAQVAERIHHPNSLQVYEFGPLPDGGAYVVEELLSGRTLRDLLRSERGFTLLRVAGLLNQMCGAVNAANVNGIVVRGLRPETVFVERGGDGGELIKLGGYGLARVDGSLAGGVSMAGPALLYGAPQYMSPEQLLGRPLDSRSDVYALGVILFELLTGSVPFDSPDPDEVIHKQLEARVPDLTQLRRDLDEGVAAVVNRALAKDPARRQPTALDLASELQAVSGPAGEVVGLLLSRATRVLPVPPAVPAVPAPVPPGEAALPSVVPPAETRGRGPFNAVILALMAEAFLSRMSSGILKTTVPLYALLVFGFDATDVMLLVLAQNIVPLLLRPRFGTLADRHGKKRVFLFALVLRTLVGVLYAVANLPALFLINVIRGIADSAKVPSGSAMIADSTDEKHVATAYSWYTTTKSTSGGVGEALAAFLLGILVVLLLGSRTVPANVAVLEAALPGGAPTEKVLKDPSEVGPDGTIPGDKHHPGPYRVLRVERRDLAVRDVPMKDLPKVIDPGMVRGAVVILFLLSASLSALSLLLVWVFVKEAAPGGRAPAAEAARPPAEAARPAAKAAPPAPAPTAPDQPNVWAFALLGTALTAPAYMVTGEFFTILVYKLSLTGEAFGWIKLFAEILMPLLFGPFFGWLADRIGANWVIALRSVANLLTSLLFWVTPWFLGTALLALIMGAARAVDEIGKAAFKPTWGAVAAKVSSFNLAGRSRTMGILEMGVDTSDLIFPLLSGALIDRVSLGLLMGLRALLALAAEVYGYFLTHKHKIF